MEALELNADRVRAVGDEVAVVCALARISDSSHVRTTIQVSQLSSSRLAKGSEKIAVVSFSVNNQVSQVVIWSYSYIVSAKQAISLTITRVPRLERKHAVSRHPVRLVAFRVVVKVNVEHHIFVGCVSQHNDRLVLMHGPPGSIRQERLVIDLINMVVHRSVVMQGEGLL